MKQKWADVREYENKKQDYFCSIRCVAGCFNSVWCPNKRRRRCVCVGKDIWRMRILFFAGSGERKLAEFPFRPQKEYFIVADGMLYCGVTEVGCFCLKST